jgi:ornithine cyclodeaminase/alanine dehydrogenase
MLAAKRSGVDFTRKLVSLNDVIGQRHPGRKSAEEIVLYKSVGSALQDVVISEMLLRRARALHIGTRLPVSIRPVSK